MGKAFFNAIHLNYSSLDTPYVEGVSLTHGPAGRRRHIWTFATALVNGDSYFFILTNTVTDPILTSTGHTPYPMIWDMTTSAIVMERLLKIIIIIMKMMIYGMEKGVTQAAAAVNSTAHLTSVNTFSYTTSEDMEITLLSHYPFFLFHAYTTVSLIEIFVK